MIERVRRFNDETLEYVVAACRILAAVAALYGLAAVLTYAWTSDGRWAVQAVLSALVAIGTGWLGYWYWGNSSWRRTDGDH